MKYFEFIVQQVDHLPISYFYLLGMHLLIFIKLKKFPIYFEGFQQWNLICCACGLKH